MYECALRVFINSDRGDDARGYYDDSDGEVRRRGGGELEDGAAETQTNMPTNTRDFVHS